MALELGMLPTRFLQEATSEDIGLIAAYRRSLEFRRAQAEEQAALEEGATRNAIAARDL